MFCFGYVMVGSPLVMLVICNFGCSPDDDMLFFLYSCSSMLVVAFEQGFWHVPRWHWWDTGNVEKGVVEIFETLVVGFMECAVVEKSSEE